MNQLIAAESGAITTERRSTNPVVAYLSSLHSDHSRRAMRNALQRLADTIFDEDPPTIYDVPWHELRYEHTQALRARLYKQYSAATVNQTLSALRQVLKFCRRLGIMNADDYANAADVENVSGETLPTGRHIKRGEVQALFAACDSSPQGKRDAAILALLYGCGLRRAEVAGMMVADYERENGSVRVRGKGKKERAVPLPPGAIRAIDAYLAERGDEPGPMFVRVFVDKELRLEHGAISDQGIYHIVTRLQKAAAAGPIRPHDFRRTYIGDLLDAGADIVTVQKMAGHAAPTTTSRYDRRGERARKQAANLLHVPYNGEEE